jgi:hypothetical protein
MIVGKVWGVCPIWPPGKTRAVGLRRAVFQKNIKIVDGRLQILLAVDSLYDPLNLLRRCSNSFNVPVV